MKNINYEKAFKKLVMQIDCELGWAREDLKKKHDDTDVGMVVAYEIIMRTAEELSKDEYDFESDETQFERRFDEKFGV